MDPIDNSPSLPNLRIIQDNYSHYDADKRVHTLPLPRHPLRSPLLSAIRMLLCILTVSSS
ncbi:hypothetical protein J6590_073070 [Homalodisca vitripennis]|nr:hypothetical protein J6590_073070 [Homalodisca vitripennis]